MLANTIFHSYLLLHKVISSATFELKSKIYWWEFWGILGLKKVHPFLGPVYYYKQEDWRSRLGYLLSLHLVSSPCSSYKRMHSRLLFGFFFRAYPWPEDWNSEKGRSTVFYEDVHGLKEIIYLPYEVSVKLKIVIWHRGN